MVVTLAVARAIFGDAGGWSGGSAGGDFFFVAGNSGVREGESGADGQVDDHAVFGGDDRIDCGFGAAADGENHQQGGGEWD